MRSSRLLTAILLLGAETVGVAAARENAPRGVIELSGEVLRDKIRGGLLGQMLGNLNGLEHENAYIDEPGNVRDYTPALPEGARTDDNTDLEWVYVVAMQDEGRILLPPSRIAGLWREHINEGIWCADLREPIESWIRRPKSKRERARAAYLAICLDLAGDLAAESPSDWQEALEALRGYPRVLENLFDREPGTPAQAALQARARAAGLGPPTE
jgi:hypothetical protein